MFHIRSYFAVLASRTVPISLARTTRHVPRLDGQVNRDNTIPSVVEGDFVTHRGIAGPTGKVVAIKCLRLLSRHYEEGVGVMSSLVTTVLLGINVYTIACSLWDLHLDTT